MILYLSLTNKTIPNQAESDTDFRNLVDQIGELDGIHIDTLSGQKGLAGTDLIAAEVIKAGAATKLAEVIGGWLLKDRSRSLKLKIDNHELEVSGLTKEEQQNLVKWFQHQASIHIHLEKG